MLLPLRNTVSSCYGWCAGLAMAVSQVAPCVPQVAGGMIRSGELGIHTAKPLLLEREPLGFE